MFAQLFTSALGCMGSIRLDKDRTYVAVKKGSNKWLVSSK